MRRDIYWSSDVTADGIITTQLNDANKREVATKFLSCSKSQPQRMRGDKRLLLQRNVQRKSMNLNDENKCDCERRTGYRGLYEYLSLVFLYCQKTMHCVKNEDSDVDFIAG